MLCGRLVHVVEFFKTDLEILGYDLHKKMRLAAAGPAGGGMALPRLPSRFKGMGGERKSWEEGGEEGEGREGREWIGRGGKGRGREGWGGAGK